MLSANKIYKDLAQQIKLQSNRGLIISDDNITKRIIESENYYNIFNGYKNPFLDKNYNGPDEKYLQNTSFNEIYALYKFDRELRNIFIRFILEIENTVKSVLARVFSQRYGYDNYLKISNFDITYAFSTNISQDKLVDVTDLIAKIEGDLSNQLSKNNSMITHYMLKYGYVPLWVLVNILTLGRISKFYSHLKQKDQNNIARFFNLKSDELGRILKVLTLYRNACAHNNRLYNLKSKDQIPTLSIHQNLNIPVNNSNNLMYGKKDLFAVVIIFKTLLSNTSFQKFFDAIENLIQILSKELTTINISDIEREMGFILNWKDIK